jgi:hypothetical protein
MSSAGVVKRLDNETVSYVKATTILGSFSRIVEECMNAPSLVQLLALLVRSILTVFAFYCTCF